MSGFVVGDAKAKLLRKVGLATADHANEILLGEIPAGLARRLAGHADPFLDVGAGVTASSKRGFVQERRTPPGAIVRLRREEADDSSFELPQVEKKVG